MAQILPQVSQVTTETPTNIAQLEAALKAATDALDKFIASGEKLNADTVKKYQALNSAVDNANRAYTVAVSEMAKNARIQAASDAKAVGEQFATNPAIVAMFEAGLTGLHIVRDSSGTIQVNIGGAKTEKGEKTATGEKRNRASGKYRHADGREFKTRAVVETFGTEEEKKVIDEVDNPDKHGLTTKPGYNRHGAVDAIVKRENLVLV